VFGKVDAHAFKAVSGQERDERRVFLFHLIGDVLKRLPHGVLDHLLFGFLDLLEAFVEVGEDFREEGGVGLIKRLFDSHDAFLVRIDRVHQELDHVSRLDSTYSLFTFVSMGNFGNYISSTDSSELSCMG
jgi:hypothetical protein